MSSIKIVINEKVNVIFGFDDAWPSEKASFTPKVSIEAKKFINNMMNNFY
jgi:hypothetical protein